MLLLPEWKCSKNPCQEDKYGPRSQRGAETNVQREVHQSRARFPTARGSVCGEVCACPCVCSGTSVWQTLGHIEGPGDVPWALASRSEGSPWLSRPAWVLARIRPSPAWYKGKAAFSAGEASGPADMAGLNPKWDDRTEGSGVPQWQGDQPLKGGLSTDDGDRLECKTSALSDLVCGKCRDMEIEG